MKRALNEDVVKKLKPPRSGNTRIFDTSKKSPPGFGVRITSSGVVSFILDYRTKQHRQRQFTFGRYPTLSVAAAREVAHELIGQIAKGEDPMVEREESRRVGHTVNQLADHYLEWARGKASVLGDRAHGPKRASSIRNDEYMLNRFIKPLIGKQPVDAVNSDDILKVRRFALYRGGTPKPVRDQDTPAYYQANRVLALLSAMFSLAGRTGQDNPANRRDVQRFDKEEPRERWLTAAELAALDSALNAYEFQDAANALRLLILTGSRRSEVLNATWNQFDLTHGIWTKPSHSTKEKKDEYVRLNRAALSVVKRMAGERNGSEFLFPGDEKGERPRTTVKRVWLQVLKTAGLAEASVIQNGKRQKTTWKPLVRLHDIRHSYASHLVNAGVPLSTIGKQLGHRQAKTTERYAHVFDEAQTAAANQFDSIWRGIQKNKAKLLQMRVASVLSLKQG